MAVYITVQSCTIMFLGYCVVCIAVAAKCKAHEPIRDGIAFAVGSPILAGIAYLICWFVFNAVIGNFN